MKIDSSELVVVAFIVVIGAIVLTGYFVAGRDDARRDMPVDEPAAKIEPADKQAKPVRSTDTRTPKLELSTENVSFGEIGPHDIKNAEITVRNVGDEPLIIEGIKSSCGCTSADVSESAIAPGEETSLSLELDPQHYGGPSPRISVMINTNDPDRKVAKVTVSAEISPEFEIWPRTLDFGDVAAGNQPELTVRVDQKLDETVVVEGLNVQHPGLDVKFEELPPEEGTGYKRYEVRVRVRQDCELGPLTSEMGILTNIERASIEPVIIRGEVIGVRPAPSTMNFGMLAPVSGEIASILVSGPYEFEIVSASVDVEGFDIKTEKGYYAAEHIARIVMAENVRPGPKHGAVKIIAEGANRRRVMVIPFHGLVDDAGERDRL